MARRERRSIVFGVRSTGLFDPKVCRPSSSTVYNTRHQHRDVDMPIGVANSYPRSHSYSTTPSLDTVSGGSVLSAHLNPRGSEGVLALPDRPNERTNERTDGSKRMNYPMSCMRPVTRADSLPGYMRNSTSPFEHPSTAVLHSTTVTACTQRVKARFARPNAA